MLLRTGRFLEFRSARRGIAFLALIVSGGLLAFAAIVIILDGRVQVRHVQAFLSHGLITQFPADQSAGLGGTKSLRVDLLGQQFLFGEQADQPQREQRPVQFRSRALRGIAPHFAPFQGLLERAEISLDSPTPGVEFRREGLVEGRRIEKRGHQIPHLFSLLHPDQAQG